MGYELSVIISNACNYRCSFCQVDKDVKGILSMDQIEEIVEWSNTVHVETCLLFGGEPLLYLDEVKALSKVRCDKFLLLTNGTRFSDEAIAWLQDNPWIRVAVAIDGPPEVYRKQRGAYRIQHGQLDKLENWKGCDLALTLDLLPRLAESVRYIYEECGLENIFVNFVREKPYSDADIEVFEDQLREVMDYIIDRPIYFSLLEAHHPDGGIFCDLGKKTVSVGSDGKVYLCYAFATMAKELLDPHNLQPTEGFKFSDIREFRRVVLGDSIKNWEPHEYEYPAQCKVCPVKSTCVTCPASYYMTGGNLDAIPEWFCKVMFRKDALQREYMTNRAKLWGKELMLPLAH
ncbi:MAG: radical SAM protein [Planctomycetes bacterium]|nr:radical SAM protein [Planctomycetota bacterium]